ncbi:unnamed protein product [Trichobilharzia regenti]|nr:unnamed protein product [Trichobilharzia regenti]
MRFYVTPLSLSEPIIHQLRYNNNNNSKVSPVSYFSPIKIYLCVLPDSERQWKSKLRTAPNPEFLEQWTFNIPLISIHQSTLLCTIIGHYGVGKEFPYGNAILPMEKLNLNTENVLTLHFEPKYVHAAYLTPLSSTKLQKETNDSEAPQNLQIIPLPKVLLSLRLNPDTGRLECCLQQITLVDLRVGNRIPKRSKSCCLKVCCTLKIFCYLFDVCVILAHE